MKPTVKSIAGATLGALLTLALLGQSGCAGLLAGGGTATAIRGGSYSHGELKVTENAPLDRVWDAALAALKELPFPITSQQKDALTAELTARTPEGKTIHLRCQGLLQKTTEVRIRVGTFGDEALSLLIEERIQKQL